jgi:hypothetical protein
MLRMVRWPVAVVFLALAQAGAGAGEAKYSIKTEKAEPPKELQEPIRKLLNDQAVQLLDANGKPICELWFCKELSAKATPEQVKKGLNYRALGETTLMGAIRFVQPATDYRKQKIKPGVYTLRLGFQPMDGDHMGTAPHPEFCLLSPAAEDKKPDRMSAKELQELSAKAIGESHPGILLLFPNSKPPDNPQLVSKGEGHWVLSVKEEVLVGDQKVTLGIALTLIGFSNAA